MNSVKTIKMNAKQEFLNEIRNKSKVLCSIITYYKKGKEEDYHLTTGWTDEDLEIFLKSIDFEYDDGYGTQLLYGNIWYDDGTWSERVEYDGSENWLHKKVPEIPKFLIRKDKERDKKFNELGI